MHRLVLNATAVADAGLARLEAMAALSELSLDNCTGVTGRGLVHLQGIATLRTLRLQGTGIDDEAVPALTALKGLERLYAGKTRLSVAAVAALQKALPKLKVSIK